MKNFLTHCRKSRRHIFAGLPHIVRSAGKEISAIKHNAGQGACLTLARVV
ncbi:MAG: hypothetical protein LBS79_02655 [Tannerella sp.]|nr:hypothetical protein [Tannerella sp.]